jgi:hypothetical protein
MGDDEDDNAALAKVVADLRKIGGFRFISPEGKATNERWDAVNALRALGLPYADFKHRKGDDPPDCQAIVNGELWGIEVTELLDASMRYREWTREDFLAALQKIINRKDAPTELKGGPYLRYLLVVWTGEVHLTPEALEQFLAGEAFTCSLITDACIALDYHPGLADDDPQAYPAVPITIRRSDPEFQNQKSEPLIR